MFFLQQISTQFKLQIANHDAQPGPGGGWENEFWNDAFPVVNPDREPATIIPGSALDNLVSQAPQGEDIGSQMSPEELQEFIAEFQDRLGWLTLNRQFVAGQLKILINGLTPIARGDVPGYDKSDPEYNQVRATIDHLREIHEWLVGEIGTLNAEIHNRLRWHVWDVGNYVEYVNENEEQQQEFDRLETQRDSYGGILREKLSEYRIQDSEWTNIDYELSTETLAIVQEIEWLLWEELEGNLDTQIARLREINGLIYGPLNWEGVRNSAEGLDANLNMHLVFEEELVLRDNYINNYLDFQMTLIEGREIPQDIQDHFQTIRDRELDWSVQIQTETLRDDNQVLPNIIARLRSELWEITDTERVELDRLRSEYDDTLLLVTEKVWPFVWQEGLTRNMQLALDEFAVIQQNPLHLDSDIEQDSDSETLVERRSDIEILALLRSGANENLLELDRLVDIALRDESIIWWEDWERLWDIRETSTNVAYERVLASDWVTEALQDGEWNIPSFEELRMNDIVILRDLWVNLAELFLVDREWNSISGNVTPGNSYIINFWENGHLSWRINFAFLAMNTQEISVDGNELVFEDNSFKLDGENYNMMDGSLIVIGENFEDIDWSEERTQRHTAINEYMDSLWVSDTHDEIIQTALQSPNPQQALEMATLPGWLAWFFIALVLNFWDGRNFTYDSERGIFVDQEDEPLTAQDALNGNRWVYYDNGQRVDISSSFEDLPPGVGSLINTIYQAESRWDPNIIYWGSPIQPPRPITQMSVREVRRFQDQMVSAGSASSAVGACQIIRGTMDGAISAWVLDPGENFDVAAQNRFTIWKMEQRGLNRFMSGSMSQAAFMESLAMEWASLPKDMGWASYYAWDWLNHALVSPQTMVNHLREIWQW